LQNKVFFEIMFFFCRRGRQNLRELKRDDFAIRCVVKKSDELTKNHRVHDAQAEERGMMVVYSFEKYLTHLNPLNEFLFQRPKRCSPSDGIIWHDNMVVGENTLGKKMKVLSKEAKLSVKYTNHSIRATTITILDRNGYEARHIMSVSGHRSESILKSYTKTGDLTKSKMASCLSSAIDSSEHHVAEIPNAINPGMSALAT
jgi:site-specific recombinase XerD